MDEQTAGEQLMGQIKPNINVFRSEYKELPGEIKNHILLVKDLANNLYERLSIPNGSPTMTQARAIALAKTKLEESVMWMTKALTE